MLLVETVDCDVMNSGCEILLLLHYNSKHHSYPYNFNKLSALMPVCQQ